MTVLAPNQMFSDFVDEPGFIFLDETNQCPPDGMGALMALFLERRAGFLQLHPDCWLVGAMNPGRSGTATRRMGSALVSRLAQLWVEPTAVEVSAMHRAGYPCVPLASDQARRDVHHAQLDRLLAAYWSSVGGLTSEEPEGWEGEPIPTVRGWRLGIACLARVRAMQEERPVCGASWADAQKAAEELVVGACVGNEAAAGLLSFERSYRVATPLDVLTGRVSPPALSGAQAVAWLDDYVDEVIDSVRLCGSMNYWWDGTKCRAAELLPSLISAFGADLYLPANAKMLRGIESLVTGAELNGVVAGLGTRALGSAFKAAGLHSIVTEARNG
jgi:hypothetical protein